MLPRFTRENAVRISDEVLGWLSGRPCERQESLMEQVRGLGPGGEAVVEALVQAHQSGEVGVAHFYVGVMATLIELFGFEPSVE